MKKIIFSLAVLAIAATVALNVNLSFQKSNDISALALANIEALANGEEFTVTCGQSSGKCWIALGMLKFCGEMSYFNCIRTDDPHISCVNPC